MMEQKSERHQKKKLIFSVIVLLILVLILSWASIEMWKYKQTRGSKVCLNLYKDIGEKVNIIYPAVENTVRDVERGWGMNILSVKTDLVSVKSENSDGVVCEFPVDACVENMYCMELKMLVPINYTEFNIWKEEK